MNRSLVLGTAGHIDHGKSALVQALTGTDPDRLKDEKARGITIDLGFAHARMGDVDVAFVDVPGHERFVRNMLAGAGGIDAVLLVVAADESVMPQTREHVDICRLLGVDRGVVAITKSDLVDSDTIDLVSIEVAELLAGGPLAGCPRVPVSARTGAGLPALQDAIAALAARPSRRVRPDVTRLPVDRVFHMRGFGVIVTGTLVDGRLSAGDTLRVLPAGGQARVRGLQIHGAPVDRVDAPSRVAVNLGDVEGTLERGATLASDESVSITTEIDASLELLASARPLRHGGRVRVHQGTWSGPARVTIAASASPDSNGWQWAEPGASGVAIPAGGRGLVRLRLSGPAALTRGDRLILRALSPVQTIGGGLVLDPTPPRGRLRRPAARTRLERLLASPIAASTWLDEAGAAGASVPMLVGRWGLSRAEAHAATEQAVATGQARRVGARWAGTSFAGELRSAIIASIDRFHREAPLEAGLSRSTLRDRLAPGDAAELFDLLVAELTAAREVEGQERLNLPGRGAGAVMKDPARDRLADAARRAGLTALDQAGLIQAAGVTPAEGDPRLRSLVTEGRLVRAGGFLFDRQALETLRREIAALKAAGHRHLEVALIKERFGLTRKHAIPVLEWLDRERVTRRVGETRQIL